MRRFEEEFDTSRLEKLKQRIRSLDRGLRFDEVRKVLESFGYEMHSPHGGSSHCTFRKLGCEPITMPRNEPVLVVYVAMVKSVLERNGTP